MTAVTRYRLHHRHPATKCAAVFASWRGFASPLRHGVAVGSCASGGHELWWDVDADDETAALALLPDYVAARTRVIPIREVPIP